MEAASLSSLLHGCNTLIERLFAESGAHSWGLSIHEFELALDRSARKHFLSIQVSPARLEEYLVRLHLKDLALASACAKGQIEAWNFFVPSYKPYLRSAAAAILRCPPDSPAAHELADSLFTELYGLREGDRAERSLFRYFHGRSSLKTWLRAVMAQRHIDGIRVTRRFVDLTTDDDEGVSDRQSTVIAAPAQEPADPHRQRYLTLFTRALEVALGFLDSHDKERLRLYYAEQMTLVEIGRHLGEHESSVSRNLDRIRRELRADVEGGLRKGGGAVDGLSAPGLSDDEIALCFEYAAESRPEGAPIDFDKIFAQRTKQKNPTQYPKP